nr:GHKL domain-containing protein [uncultured Eisenbergiella sp.]
MYNILICCLVNLFRVVLIRRFMQVFFGKKKSGKKELIVYGVFYVVNTALYLAFHLPLLNFICNLAGIFIITRLYTRILKINSMVTLLIYFINIGCDTLAIVMFVDNYRERMIHNQVFSLITILLFFLCILAAEKIVTSKKMTDMVIPEHSLSLMLVPLISILLFLGLLFDKSSLDNMLFEMETLCLLLINMVVFYLYNEILKSYEYKIDKLLLEEKISMYTNQLDAIVNSENGIRSLQHDMKHHIIQLEIMAKQNGQKDIEEYLQKMMDFMDNPDEAVHSGNLDIDSVLNYMISKAKKRLKEVNVKVNIPSSIVAYFNINVIIGNLLENAIEAAENTENKILNIDIHYKQGVLYLDISNSYPNKVVIRENKFLTSKADSQKHGIGLMNVKKMVEEHNGVIHFLHDENLFRVKLMMYTEKEGS